MTFIKCPECGKDVLSTAKFCTFCGAKVAAAPAAAAFCTGCGSALAPGAKFCTVCGTKVAAAEAVAEEAVETAEAAVEEAVEAAEAVAEEVVETEETAVEEAAETAETVAEEVVETAEAAVEEVVETAETVAEEVVETAETAVEEAAEIAGMPAGAVPVAEEAAVQAVKKSKKGVILAVLAVLAILGLGAGNVMMLLKNRSAAEFYDGYIADLNTETAMIRSELDGLNGELSQYTDIIASAADSVMYYYDVLCDPVNNHVPEFYASTPLVVLSLSEGDVGSFYITGSYPEGIAPSREIYGSSVEMAWGDAWVNASLEIFLYPMEPGITEIVFSNDLYSDTFTVTVVVVE